MIVTHKITMDLLEPGQTPQITAVQDDRYTRNVEISLYVGGEPWTIPEEASVLICYQKNGGCGGEYNTLPDDTRAWSAEENRLTIALAPQVLTSAGMVTLVVSMISGSMELNTFAVMIRVSPNYRSIMEGSEDYVNVTGFVPAPVRAKVGQILRVSQVDENGRITAMEAVDSNTADIQEPGLVDIPKVFFGGDLPQTKNDAVMSFRYISQTMDISGYCKTKAQGTSSMGYPKKNQTVELYKNAACTEKLKVNFKNWGDQNKFCFKANWIDLTHARNIVSARLWGDVVKSRDNYEDIPEPLRTSPNQGAVDGFPVKVYAGGVYQGRYTMNIPKAAWMANMDEGLDTHSILCGENYVSGCFRAEANIDGSDWTDEIHETVPDAIKTRWNDVISFVRNSTDAEFVTGIGNYFDVPSLIDYYLFGLASCGLDGFGKNQLYMTYDGQKWYATMYDMDSTWGLWWDGTYFVPTDYGRSEYQDFRDGEGNLLYMRLENLFWEAIQSRWEVLKNGALSPDNIINRFERFADITPSELVTEDYAKTTGGGAFTGIPGQNDNTLAQIRNYAAARYLWTGLCVENLNPNAALPIYRLAEETVYDGTNYTDTGVALRNYPDYTVLFDFTVNSANCVDNNTDVFISNDGSYENGWYIRKMGVFWEFEIQTKNWGDKITNDNTETSFMSGPKKFVLVKENNQKLTLYSEKYSSGLVITDQSEYEGALDSSYTNLMIGAGHSYGQIKYHSKCTVHRCEVYNKVLSNEKITEFLNS